MDSLIENAQILPNSRQVPKDGKAANMTPLFNNREWQKTEKCNPINLTATLGKMLESITRDEIDNQFGKLNIIKLSQIVL